MDGIGVKKLKLPQMQLVDEYKKCLEDPIYFIEHYCLINGNPIKLNNSQKKFIKWINQLKLERGY